MANQKKPEVKPPSVSFDDILNSVQSGYEKDEKEHKDLPKKYKEGEGVEQIIDDVE